MKRDLHRKFLAVAGVGILLGGVSFVGAARSKMERLIRRSRPFAEVGRRIDLAEEQAKREKRRRDFAISRDVLIRESVPFEPEELLAPDWKERLEPKFSTMPQLAERREISTERVSGAYIADTLVLPEKIATDGPLVILARHLVFKGRDVEIDAPGFDVSIFVIESEQKIDKRTHYEGAVDGEAPPWERKTPSVTIRTGAPDPGDLESTPASVRRSREAETGRGQAVRGAIWNPARPLPARRVTFVQGMTHDGFNGAAGNAGTSGQVGAQGAIGTAGAAGTCPSSVNGGSGGVGARGGDGTGGGTGARGGNGTAAGNIDCDIPPGSTGIWTFSARGGDGGDGGKGGKGGKGGTGGTGGRGGNGANCNSCGVGPGSGGAGGNGGPGGVGGRGGVGGDGGNGGAGGNVHVTNYSCTAGFNAYVNGGRGGSPGQPGNGGDGGAGGAAGVGGSKGTSTCTGVTPRNGAAGSVGPAGPQGGSSGQPGAPGDTAVSGSIDVDPHCGGCASPGQPSGWQCNWDSSACVWVCTNPQSPILIDAAGNGFALTSAADGVRFDLDSDGVAEQISWTARGSDDAFLVLDRNRNGVVDDGTELFGNYTPQPPSRDPNGFLALAVFDKLANGGSGNGRMNRKDSVYGALRLWQDVNHDGISQPEELHTLSEMGVASIDLDYKETARRDAYGNWFRFRASIRTDEGADLGRYAWDVYLVGE